MPYNGLHCPLYKAQNILIITQLTNESTNICTNEWYSIHLEVQYIRYACVQIVKIGMVITYTILSHDSHMTVRCPIPVQCPVTLPLPGKVDRLMTRLRLPCIFSRAMSVAMDSVRPES